MKCEQNAKIVIMHWPQYSRSANGYMLGQYGTCSPSRSLTQRPRLSIRHGNPSRLFFLIRYLTHLPQSLPSLRKIVLELQYFDLESSSLASMRYSDDEES